MTSKSLTAHLTSSTSAVIVVGMTAAAILSSVVSLGVAGQETSRRLALVGQPVLELGAAVIAILAATRLPSRYRLFAYLATGGIIFTALGDGAWAFWELVLGEEIAYPGFSEILFGISYVCFVACLALATARFIDTEELPLAYGTALVGGGVALTIGWLFVARPAIADAGITASTIADLSYIAADVLLLLVPGAATLVAIGRSDDQSELLPLLLFSAGLVGMAIGDIAWFLQQASGGWQPGSIVDFAWTAATYFVAASVTAGVAVSQRLLDERRAVDSLTAE